MVTAHQGGLDELAFVAVPMAVMVLFLWVAARRAAREQTEEDEASPSDDAPPRPGG